MPVLHPIKGLQEEGPGQGDILLAAEEAVEELLNGNVDIIPVNFRDVAREMIIPCGTGSAPFGIGLFGDDDACSLIRGADGSHQAADSAPCDENVNFDGFFVDFDHGTIPLFIYAAKIKEWLSGHFIVGFDMEHHRRKGNA
jgi:hypothetical protein